MPLLKFTLKEPNFIGGCVEFLLTGIAVVALIGLLIAISVMRSAAEDIDNDY